MEHNTHPPKVGILVQLKRPCLDNEEGAVGVVYEVYERHWRRDDDKDRFGISVIFPNGCHDGFSAAEQDFILAVIGETTDRAVLNYKLRHVVQLGVDFDHGLFVGAFGEGLLMKVKVGAS